MPRTGSDTADRIRAIATELFARQGFDRTSLQQIADRVGMTKAALYYHFSSKEDLIRSITQPLLDDGAEMLERVQASPLTPAELFGELFDITYAHRGILGALVRDLSALSEADLEGEVIAWRWRVQRRLVGEDAPLDQQVRAVLAIGGLQDCVVMFPDADAAELRTAAVDAACAALRR